MSTTTSFRPVLSSDELATVLRRAREEQWQELALLREEFARFADEMPLSTWARERVVLVTSLPAERLDELVAIDSLRTLVLLDIGLGAEEAKALTSLTGLISLDLWNNQIGDEGAKALASLTHLISLDLGHNRLGDEGAKALASLTSLTSLTLESNQLGDEGAKALASLTSLTSLELWDNQIGDEGAKALASLTRLASLELGDNQIGDEGAKALASLTSLTSLDLRSNQIGGEGAKALASLPSLTSLDLGSNQIDGEGAKALASLPSLTSLGLGSNQIDGEGAKALASLTRLTSLDLGNNQIGDEGVQALTSLTGLTSLELGSNRIGNEGAKALASLTSLTSLELRGNQISAEGAKVLASLTRLTSLELGGNQLGDEGAKALASLTSLTSLDLMHNQIGDDGAKALASLTSLTSLRLGHNQIGDDGAKALASLTSLTSLDLGDNRLGDEGAKALASLTSLASLELWGTQISDEGAKALASLTSLTSLDLGSNRIGDEGAKALASLTSLVSLELWSNRIGDEGAKALASLTSLASLELWSNRIGDEGAKALASLTSLTSLELDDNRIGDEGARALASLTSLTSLNLRDNQIGDEGAKALASLPNLRNLVLSSNHIRRSRLLVAMPSLTELHLFGNPLLDAPRELLGGALVDECLSALRAYYRDLNEGAAPNRVVKVLLVGNGCVGKTTLAHCLAKGYPPAEPVTERTHGIELQTFDLTLSTDESIEVHLWDFGGQERYHAMHRLFMHQNALYLLLWAEKPDEYRDEERHPVTYWLDMLEHLAPGAGVLLVKNQIDRSDEQGRPRELEGRDLSHLREVKVSAAQHRNLDTLKAALAEMLRDVRLRWGYLLPASWLKVRDTLEVWRQTGDDGKPLRQLARGRFEQLCAQHGVTDAGVLLTFLHETGSVYHRAGRFGDSIILDQDWLLSALYRLFDKKSGAYISACELGGVLRGAIFASYWSGEPEVDVGTYFGFLLQTGMAFELTPNYAKPFAERLLVVPALLPTADDERLRHVQKPWRRALPDDHWLRLVYDFLHRGEIERIIVELSKLSPGHAWWREGLLVDDAKTDCSIYLHANLTDHTLDVRLRDGHHVEAFARVREALDKLLRRPPTCTLVSNDGATFINLATLDKALREGKTHVATTQDDIVEREPFDRFAPFTRPPKLEQGLLPEKPTAKATRIFISYAQEDQSYRDALVKQLTMLKRQLAIDFWHNEQLLAGTEVADEIGRQLDAADVTLLLISTDFINSDQCFSSEMAKALEKYDEKRGIVVPIVVRPTTGWQDLLIGRHRALPSNQDPISRWPDKDEAWADVSAGLLTLLKQRGATPR